MRVIHTTDIAAPIDHVWRITCDVEKWPEWTPTVTSVQLVDGSPLRLGSVARIKQPMQSLADWEVTEFIEGRRFAWTAQRPGMRFTGVHDLTATAGGTRNRLELEASGLLAILLWPVLGPGIRRTLAAENAALARRCEEPAEGAPLGSRSQEG